MSLSEEQVATKTILVVEDDAEIGAFLVEAIEQETPYQIALFSDGLQALKVVKEIKPNLFIFNYRLPGINGIELYDQLHATKELEAVPAILLSATLPTQEIAKRGMVGMHKPVEVDDLLETIEHLLS